MAEDTGAQIAKAWEHHREQRNNDARREFEAILKTEPDDIDALYGLGLVLRATGEKAEAISAFQKAFKLSEVAATEDIAHEHDANALVEDTLSVAGHNPRYTMLCRMIQQRLKELDAAS